MDKVIATYRSIFSKKHISHKLANNYYYCSLPPTAGRRRVYLKQKLLVKRLRRTIELVLNKIIKIKKKFISIK